MTALSDKFLTVIRLSREGRFRLIRRIISERLFSRSTAWGLYSRLEAPIPVPPAKVPISVRPYRDGDWDSLSMQGELYDTEPETADSQASLLQMEGGVCYVAVDAGDCALFMQPVFGPGRDGMRVRLNDDYPALEEGAALLEGAYTRPDFRGLGIMSAAVAMIANRLREQRLTRLVTFVGNGNAASLKALQKAGFEVYSLRMSRWLLFWRHTSYEAPRSYSRQPR